MGQPVIIGGVEVYLDGNDYLPNIAGNPLPKKVAHVDFFTTDTLSTDMYTETSAGTAAATAMTAGGLCGVTHTTGTDDNATMFLATGLIFDISNNPVIETRVNINDTTGTMYFFGFSDAVSETTPAATIDYADGTLAAAATDAVGFLVDKDKESARIYLVNIATAGSVTAAEASPQVAWVSGESRYLRVALDKDGGATFYMGTTLQNIIPVGYIAGAVTDVPLCAIINAGNRDGSSDVLYTRYLAMFQDIP